MRLVLMCFDEFSVATESRSPSLQESASKDETTIIDLKKKEHQLEL